MNAVLKPSSTGSVMLDCDLNLDLRVPTLCDPQAIATLAEEPSLFSASWGYARDQGGALTQQILDTLAGHKAIETAERAGLSAVIDVRVQRLMPGMFPSIPGWHCDAVPRSTYHSQPDFARVDPLSRHFTVIASTAPDGVSATQFLGQPIEFDYDNQDPLWKQLHRRIEDNPRLRRIRVQNGQVASFSTLTPHRTMPTTTRGWRLFFRLSMYHNPPLQNGSPNCQQVYLLSEENGW